jgi:hypothetical protein
LGGDIFVVRFDQAYLLHTAAASSGFHSAIR